MAGAFTPGYAMRSLIVLLLVAGFAHAGASLGTLTADTILRGSPKADGPDAGSFPRGTTVIVHHEEGDWLALQAPRGSVSWISHLFLEFPDKTPNAGFPKNAVVRSEGEVKLAVGKPGHPKPLDARKTAVPEGTIVLAIGPAVKSDSDGSTWYPIVPPEDDFRYVPKSAVQLSNSAAGSFTVKSPATSANTSPPPVASIAGPTPVGKAGWPNHPLWVQAEAAEAAGDLDKAERLYFQLAKEMNAPGGDGELANQCYSRVHAIRERRRAGPVKTANWNTTTTPVPTPAAIPTLKPGDDFTPRTVEKPVEKSEKSEKPADSKGQWSGSGYLRLAGFKLGGKQAYGLEDTKGRLLYYAVAGSNFDLEKHRNKTVDLFGAVSNPKDLRNIPLIEVTKVDAVK